MKTTARKPEPVSHVIQSRTKAANQAPMSQILQRYKDKIIQRVEMPEEDELLQGKFETTQLMELDEDEEPLQGKFETLQKEEQDSSLLASNSSLNKTGMPDNLKNGIESMSGYSMDNVRVHYNSPKPAQLQALAYTQGTDIHVAPGQEKHLPHEAWHVVQQMQGRVQPTTQLQGVNINDNAGLEHEADVMGEKAMVQRKEKNNVNNFNTWSNTYQLFTQVAPPNLNQTTVGVRNLNANQTLVSITSKSFSWLPGMNHHMVHVETFDGVNCYHYRTDFNPADADAKLFSSEQAGIITTRAAVDTPINLPASVDVVHVKLLNRFVQHNEFEYNDRNAFRYKMLMPNENGVHNCKTWASMKYNAIN